MASRGGRADVVRQLLSVLPKTARFQAISHTDNKGNNSLPPSHLQFQDHLLERAQDTVKALFEPLSHAEKLAIVNHPNNEGLTMLSCCPPKLTEFIEEQLKAEGQQQCHSSIVVPQSIFSDSATERLPSNAPAG